MLDQYACCCLCINHRRSEDFAGTLESVCLMNMYVVMCV